MKGPKESYVTLMDQAILAKAEADKANPPYYPLRPSSASKCARRLAHELAEYVGIESRTYEDKKPHIHRLLDLGNAIERHFINYLRQIPDTSIKFTQQVVEMFRLDREGTIIEGSTDLVLWGKHGRCLADAKSVGDRFHSAYETKWKGMIAKYDKLNSITRIDDNGFYVPDLLSFLADIGPDDSLYDNLTQVNLYLCSDFMRSRGVDHGAILRYLKNTSECMEIRFAPSQELFDKVKAKFNLIDQAVARGEPDSVPSECTLGTMSCAFSPHCQKHCWPQADTLKSWFATFPKRTFPQLIGQMYNKDRLEALFANYLLLESSADQKDVLAQQIVKEMVAEETTKVKLADGSLFEAVPLKSPRPRIELRRVAK